MIVMSGFSCAKACLLSVQEVEEALETNTSQGLAHDEVCLKQFKLQFTK